MPVTLQLAGRQSCWKCLAHNAMPWKLALITDDDCVADSFDDDCVADSFDDDCIADSFQWVVGQGASPFSASVG